jgi:hypothetical protein
MTTQNFKNKVSALSIGTFRPATFTMQAQKKRYGKTLLTLLLAVLLYPTVFPATVRAQTNYTIGETDDSGSTRYADLDAFENEFIYK